MMETFFGDDLLGYFVDKKAGEGEVILARRNARNVFNTAGKNYVNCCMNSKVHAPELYKILP